MVCERCKDTGLWLTPRGKIESCPRLQLRQPHPSPTGNVSALRLAVKSLENRGEPISQMTFETAQIIAAFSENNPCPQSLLEEYLFTGTNLGPGERARKISSAIQELCKDWNLELKTRSDHYWIESNS